MQSTLRIRRGGGRPSLEKRQNTWQKRAVDGGAIDGEF